MATPLRALMLSLALPMPETMVTSMASEASDSSEPGRTPIVRPPAAYNKAGAGARGGRHKPAGCIRKWVLTHDRVRHDTHQIRSMVISSY